MCSDACIRSGVAVCSVGTVAARLSSSCWTLSLVVATVSVFFFSSRRRHTRCSRDWSSDVCSSDLGTVAQLKDNTIPYRVPRYDLFPAAEVQGVAAPGVASGTALLRMEELAHHVLPQGIGFEWTDLSFQEQQHGTRSEEHTSELQSRLHLVCRLLLEKKKKCKDNSLGARRADDAHRGRQSRRGRTGLLAPRRTAFYNLRDVSPADGGVVELRTTRYVS